MLEAPVCLCVCACVLTLSIRVRRCVCWPSVRLCVRPLALGNGDACSFQPWPPTLLLLPLLPGSWIKHLFDLYQECNGQSTPSLSFSLPVSLSLCLSRWRTDASASSCVVFCPCVQPGCILMTNSETETHIFFVPLIHELQCICGWTQHNATRTVLVPLRFYMGKMADQPCSVPAMSDRMLWCDPGVVHRQASKCVNEVSKPAAPHPEKSLKQPSLPLSQSPPGPICWRASFTCLSPEADAKCHWHQIAFVKSNRSHK